MICKKCGSQNQDDAKFCLNCGENLTTQVDEEETIEEVDFVEVEEEEVIDEKDQVLEAERVENKEEHVVDLELLAKEKGKKNNKKGIFKVFAVGLVLGLIAFVFFNKQSKQLSPEKSPLIYIKDDQLVVKSENLEKTSYLNDNIIQNVNDIGDGYLNFNNIAIKTQDNSGLYYLTNIRDGGDGYIGDIYFSEIKFTKDEKAEEGAEIAKSVSLANLKNFELVDDESKIVYMKNWESDKYRGTLYTNDLEKEDKIDDSVSDYDLSVDGKKIIYTRNYEDEETTWIYDLVDGSKGKVAKNLAISDILYHDANFEEIIYERIDFDDDEEIKNIYSVKLGESPEKLLSDIAEVYVRDKDIFYTKSQNAVYELSELVKDPEIEKNIEEPNSEDFQVEYEDFWGYTYMDTDYEAYNEALEKYHEIEYRNDMRREYNDNKLAKPAFDLYLYKDKGEDEKIISDIAYGVNMDEKAEKILFHRFKAEYERKSLDEISGIEEIIYDDSSARYERDIFLYEKGKEEKKILELDGGSSYDIEITPDFNKAYITVYDDVDSNELLECELTGEYKKNKIDSDVHEIDIISENGDIIIYKKNDEDYEQDLYLKNGEDKEKIGSKVNNYQYDLDTNTFIFMEDYNYEKDSGNLIMVKDLKRKEIDEAVKDYYYIDSDRIYYLKDYNTSKGLGDLWQYNESKEDKKERIDYDVRELLYY